MEKQEQREKEAEEAINAINKKTGRNMPAGHRHGGRPDRHHLGMPVDQR